MWMTVCQFIFVALFLCRRFPKITSGFYIRCLSIFQMWKPSHENWLIVFNVSDRFTDDCCAVSRSGLSMLTFPGCISWFPIHASLYCLGFSAVCESPPVGARLIYNNIAHKCTHTPWPLPKSTLLPVMHKLTHAQWPTFSLSVDYDLAEPWPFGRKCFITTFRHSSLLL